MGKLRVDTVTKLLTSPEKREAILQEYASTKTTKLWVKHSNDTQEDLFERSRPYVTRIVNQAIAARLFREPNMQERILDQSAANVAEISEQMGDILDICKDLKYGTEGVDLVCAYAELLRILEQAKEPFVKKAVVNTFMQIFNDTSGAQRAKQLGRPLAVAIALSCEGNPTDQKHREHVSNFLKTHFVGEAAPVAGAVIQTLGLLKRRATASLLRDSLTRLSQSQSE